MAKNQNPTGNLLDKVIALCKRRGIVFPSAEIYGGVASTYDYGPYGAPMKDNIARLWLSEMTLKHNNIVQLDSAIILHPKVWEASGHLSAFNDPLIECRECKGRFRDDDIIQEGKCPRCGAKDTLTPPRQFNMMVQARLGAIEDEASINYLRPETCQGIYLDWRIVQDTARLKIPFGIAQVGKAFRNEITTKSFIFRTREFEQMEMQFFIKPGENERWLEYWREQRWNWLLSLGVKEENLRWHKHEKLAHYAKAAYDIEYKFPTGWAELEGLHDRGDFDLSQHQQFSGKDMTYFDDETRERYIPNIIEASSGLNRTMLMLLCEAYREDEQAGEQRVYLALDPRIAPVKAAIFPLVKKDGLFEIAFSIYEDLFGKFPIFFDEQGSIGKRYRRMDEIGTPFCFTIDYQTKEDSTVTVRWRDTLEQERINKNQIENYLRTKLSGIL